jgi:hypothetical protein
VPFVIHDLDRETFTAQCRREITDAEIAHALETDQRDRPLLDRNLANFNRSTRRWRRVAATAGIGGGIHGCLLRLMSRPDRTRGAPRARSVAGLASLLYNRERLIQRFRLQIDDRTLML